MYSKKSVTIYDIAKEAGVSVSTVSRVLTKNAKVSKDKQERVEKLIKKYDFVPNALARGLSETKSNVIGIISSDIRNPFYATLFVECEKAANELGYRVVLCNSLDKNELEDMHIENLQSQRVDAIVQIGGRVDELVSDSKYVERVNWVAKKIPVVITGKLEGADCYQVNLDHANAMEMLMEYLISIGHKDIALVGGRNDVIGTVEKRSSYKKMLNKYDIEYRDEYVVEGVKYDDKCGYKGMKQLFKAGKLPSAVIAINDFTAVGVIRAVMEKGLSVPGDISVTSFDNTYISDFTIPRLTGIGYNYEQFGRKIIEVTVSAIKGEEIPRTSLIKTELVLKESCKSRQK